MTLDGDESMDKEVRLELNVVKGWVGGPYAPQILALPERGGGALPLARIFLEDSSTMH